ncbi:MAG: glycerol-3-phosphate 1-O-acyltransferase PlsY [Burkholderiales bacterium]|jgi:glycerol-3-phosphate acyltransferase PlsY|nr:glycerol-3-phosphate 1-O-acyltransferase PlsY [Burkholderiales bacterium]
MEPLALWTAVLAGYLLGSISFAVVVGRAVGLADPRSYGSTNPGATNVLRTGNKAAALLTLLGDALKGAVAVWLARHFGPGFGLGPFAFACVGAAAFLGHLYPVFFRFQGGKGVATFLGVLLALNFWIGLAACAVWLAVAAVFRYSSLASLTAAVSAPLVYALAYGLGDSVVWPLAAMAALLLWRHRENIAKLRAGTESKIGKKSAR